MAIIETGTTKLAKAVTNSNSLRTTIPRHIALKLGLNEGDQIVWDMDKTRSGKWYATIRRD